MWERRIEVYDYSWVSGAASPASVHLVGSSNSLSPKGSGKPVSRSSRRILVGVGGVDMICGVV